MTTTSVPRTSSTAQDLAILDADLQFILGEAKVVRNDQQMPSYMRINILYKCVIRLAESQQQIVALMAEREHPLIIERYVKDERVAG